jgi:hypothetical protein
MDSTSTSGAKNGSLEEKILATPKNSRGMSVRACVAKFMTWKLKSANDATVHHTSGIKESLPLATCEAKLTPN